MKLLLCRDEREGLTVSEPRSVGCPLFCVHFFTFPILTAEHGCTLREDALLALGVSVIRCAGSPHQGCLTATSQARLCQPP